MPVAKKLRSETGASRGGTQPTESRQASAANQSSGGASPMHAERLKKLYAAMLKCRIMDNLLPARLKDRWACRAREAIISGAAIHLRPEDLIVPGGVELFGRLVHDASPETIGASVNREMNPDWDGAGIQIPAASTAMARFHIAIGMALACKLQNKPSVTLCIVDGPVDGPDFWHEPVNFAARRQLAIVLVIVNTGGDARGRRTELRRNTQAIVPAITVDGNDAVAVYRVAEECTRRARQGLGPSLIECRVEGGPDPILFMENYLKARHLWSEPWKEGLVREFGREVEPAVKKYFRKTQPRTNPSGARL